MALAPLASPVYRQLPGTQNPLMEGRGEGAVATQDGVGGGSLLLEPSTSPEALGDGGGEEEPEPEVW